MLRLKNLGRKISLSLALMGLVSSSFAEGITISGPSEGPPSRSEMRDEMLRDPAFNEIPCLENCYSLATLVDITKKDNYDNREKVERLFQAGDQIRVRMGHLLPSFPGFASLAGIAVSPLFGAILVAPSLLGFLYPSNWFHWKESKFLYSAEKNSYLTMLANQVNGVEMLYYTVHRERENLVIYHGFLNFMNRVWEVAQARHSLGEISPIDLALLDAKRYDFEGFVNFGNQLVHEIYPQLAFSMGLDKDWENFSIQRIQLPNLSNEQKLNPETLYPTILEKSPEDKTLYYLIQAAGQNVRATKYSFLLPDGGDNRLGFGYAAQIRIAKGNQKILVIQKEKLQANLRDLVYRAVNDYNTAIDMYQTSLAGKNQADRVLEGSLRAMQNGTHFDIDTLLRSVDLDFRFRLTLNHSQHLFLAAKARLDRLLFAGPSYGDLETLIPGRSTTTTTRSSRIFRRRR